MPLDPNNPFSDLVPQGTPGVIQGPPKESTADSGYILNTDGSEKPRPGGPQDPNANDTLDDATTTFYAQQILAGAPMPAMGMGKVAAQNRQKVMMRVAEVAGARGLTGADLAKQIAHYKAGQHQLNVLETQLGTTRQNEGTARLNMGQAMDRSAELPLQTQYPGINAVTQFFQKNIPIAGHEDKVAMDAALQTGLTEYGKVVSGSPSGAGTLSDSARHEALAVMNGNYSLTQKAAVWKQMQADMENRLNSMKSGLNDSYDALTKQPGYEVPADISGLHVTPGKQQDHIVIPGVNDNGGDPGVMGGGGGASGGGGGTNVNFVPGPGNYSLSDDQKSQYADFLKSNPNPSGDQVNSFLTKLTGKTVTNGDQIAKAIKQGRGVSSTVDDSARIRQRIAAEDKLGLGESNVDALAKQGSTLNLSDEAAGVGNALSGIVAAPFTGKFDPVGDYTFGRDVERQRIADARQQLGYGGTAIELATGLASAGPGRFIGALTPALAAKQAATAGTVGGALAGFGSGDGAAESTAGAVGGALVGRYAPAVVGKVAPALGKVLPRRFQAPRGMAPDLADAASAENVDLIRPMVDPASRGDFGALESNPVSQNTVRAGVQNTRQQIEGRVGALSTGTPMETDTAGETLQGAGRRFIQRSKGVADALYNRARALSGDTRFVPQNALDQVDGQIEALSANPQTNAGEIKFLQGLKSDLSTDGGKTVDELRQLRTSLRGRVNEQNLGATQAEARAVGVLNAAQQDVAQNVPQAASAFSRADTYYRERQTHIDDIIQRITGGKVGQTDYQVSGEQAFNKLKSMASPGGDGRRLGALMRELDPNERQDIAATIATQLGRDAPDQPFSAAKFLSQTNKLSPSARRTIFGPDGAQSIQNLRTLSQALKDAGGDVNYSRSGSNVIRFAAKNFIGRITGLGAGAGVGFAAGGETGAITGVVGSAALSAANAGKTMLSARAMVNPRVSRWLAESANASTPAQAKEATRKLGVIIAREPAIAHELKPIYDMLQNRLELPLAANPDQSGGGNDQQQ